MEVKISMKIGIAMSAVVCAVLALSAASFLIPREAVHAAGPRVQVVYVKGPGTNLYQSPGVIATCPSGYAATGGGYEGSIGLMYYDGPTPNSTGALPTGWKVTAGYRANSGYSLTWVYAVCEQVGDAGTSDPTPPAVPADTPTPEPGA